MTDNQTMDYYVWPQHLYSHSRTCTCSRLCRRLSILVAFLYATSLIVLVFMRFQLSWFDSDVCQISSAFMEILVICISSSWRLWSIYIVHGDDHTCHILYHAYSWPLYSYVSRTAVCICSHMQRYLYYIVGWMVLPPCSSSLHFWDGLIMYFGHRITPVTSHIRGHML